MDLFFQNYFCRIPNHDSAFVVVSKNACTYLKKIALREAGILLNDSKTIHDVVGYQENYYLTRVPNMPKNAVKRFAVWRDPVERLLSTYKWFVIEKHPNLYFSMCGVYDMDFPRFLRFVEMELQKKSPVMMDEHLRPQSGYYSLSDVDDIVEVSRLDKYLKDNNIEPMARQNESKCHFQRKLSEEEGRIIVELYAADYEMMAQWQKRQ